MDPSSEPDQFQVVFLTRLIKNIVFHRHMVTCSQSGMTLIQGWDFTLYFFERIARFLWAKERNSDSLFSKSNGSNSLKGIKKGKSVKNCQKHNENYEYFPANRLFFESERAKVWFSLKKWANPSCHSLLKSDLLLSLFCKERRERFAWGRSFLKSNESELLTVAL